MKTLLKTLKSLKYKKIVLPVAGAIITAAVVVVLSTANKDEITDGAPTVDED